MKHFLAFIILTFSVAGAHADLTVVDDGKALTVKGRKGNAILSYQHADYPPPEGVDKSLHPERIHPSADDAKRHRRNRHPSR